MKWLKVVVLVLVVAVGCSKGKEGEGSGSSTPPKGPSPFAKHDEPTAPVEPAKVVTPPEPERPVEPEPPAPPPAPEVTAQVCTGEDHTCVMQASGKVFCAGRGIDGELGDGTAQDRRVFTPVVGLADAVELVCGYHHSCVRHKSGEVSCWGRSYHGELGSGTTDPTHVPVKVTGLAEVEQLGAGDGFACARVKGGKVWCWGTAADGRLGTGETEGVQAAPAAVKELSDAKQLGVGRAHACAVKGSGELVCWGENARGQLGRGDEVTGSSSTPVVVAGLAGVTLVAGGGNHTCALTEAGLRCWGSIDYGQVGNGAKESGKMAGTPQEVKGELGEVRQLALGTTRSCVVLGSGEVKCWGYNNYAANLLQVGSEEEAVLEPAVVQGVAGVTQLATSYDHACVLATGGKLSCWGSQSYGKLGIGPMNWDQGPKTASENVAELTGEASVKAEFPPDPEAALEFAPHLAVGDKHVCSVTVDGKVVCFGSNSEGELGIGSTQPRSSGAALPVAGLTDATQVSANLGRTCARRANGEVACWGKLLGGSSSLPLPVAGLTEAAEVAVGGTADTFFACARKADGTVWCWGGNHAGQCGTGERSNEDVPSPVQVQGLEGAVQLAAGYSTACARLGSGKVACWGSDSDGALGNGDDEGSYVPVEVPRLARVTHLAGYGSNFCVVAANKAQCWGANDDGQIGNGKMDREAPAASPTVVAGVSNVALVDTGWGTTCAVQKSGKALCWGENGFGQTGHNDAETDNVLRGWAVLSEQDETVKGFGAYVVIDCGRNFCCGLHVGGDISCMGSTPINGGDDFFGMGVARSAFPVAAGGIRFAPPAATD